MSNFLAISTVTAAINHLLEEIQTDIPGVKIHNKPLDIINSEPSANMLNLFLYHISYNTAYKTEFLPTRNSSGELVSRPKIGLDLHYLLTAYGTDNDDLLSQQILGSAIRIITENPILTKDIISDAIKSQEKVQFSDLPNDIQTIKLEPEMFSVEELTKVWSSFFQTNYRLSMAFQASVLLLDTKKQPKPPMPVKERLVYVKPIKQPVIIKIEPQNLEYSSDAQIKILGKNLQEDKTFVHIDDKKVEPPVSDIAHNKISIKIPSGLTAGIKKIKISHPIMLGLEPTEHQGANESNLGAFILSPKITKITPQEVNRGSILTVDFEPPILSNQQALLLVGDQTFVIEKHQKENNAINNVSIKISDEFPAGTYLLRLRVDGAESRLLVDDNPDSPTYLKYVEPYVKIK
ncbi:MAG: DUF4255 domain-containing protein [Nitrosopumilus sp.]|nr:DUF4255 domain-containing protein [Nitrosopumilus sp.]MDH3735400.1 DUF4255 domain-containing protein [Nitrosopumilus sp.]MDH3822238.1 DUF4255 domain-containing protein [Nitrosopumilus sp.]MDH3832566.1 DUF4255 domain-containing protein [Nitrosopumilus sp.]